MTDRPPGKRGFGADRRGLSDVLGYIVVFSLIITSVLLVTAGGLSTIEDARDTEQVENAERAFDVVAESFAAIYERNAPSRATEIDLGDGDIIYGSNVSITVEGDDRELVSRQLRPIEMRVTDDRSLIYEGGAVFRQTGGGVSVVEDPPILVESDRAHVPVVQTTADALESAGSTTILLRGVSTRRSVEAADESFSDLTIEVASPRYEAWESHLSENPALTCGVSPDTETVECTATDIGSTFVTHQQIEVSILL